MYWIDNNTGRTTWVCRTVCPKQGITELMARHNCNGVGCCSFPVNVLEADSIELKFVRKINTRTPSNWTSLLWDRISISDGSGSMIVWTIMDRSWAPRKDLRSDFISGHLSQRLFFFFLSANWWQMPLRAGNRLYSLQTKAGLSFLCGWNICYLCCQNILVDPRKKNIYIGGIPAKT